MNKSPKKKCSKCGAFVLLTEFSERKESKDGLKPSCKKCHSEYCKQYNIKNNDELKKKKRLHYEANKEKHREYCALYRAANKEKILKIAKAYRKANKEAIKKRAQIFREKNRDKLRLANKKHRETNYEKVKLQQKKYRDANRRKRATTQAKYYKTNMNLIHAKQFFTRGNIKAGMVPLKLLALKESQLSLKRALKSSQSA